MKDDTFSKQDIETIVDRAFDGEQVEVLSYQLVRHSKEKVGFLGTHQNLELTIKRADKSEPEMHRLFVKAMPQMSEEQLKFIRERNLFGQEATYFNEIWPTLKQYCPTTEDWCPKCLLANDKLVVLEDMRERDYAMSTSKIFNVEQLHAAFKAQARLHATSLVAEKQLGKPLIEVFPKGCTEHIFSEAMLEQKRIDLYTDLAEKIAQKLGLDSRRIRAGFLKGFYQMYDQAQIASKLPKVFEHGDAWPNNYLFDTSDPPKCVLVDFQLTRYGPPTYDLALLTYLGTTRDFRQREERKAIEAYHQEFCEVLEKNDPEIKRPALEDVLQEYETLRLTAMLCAAMYYPIIWVDKSTFAKYGEEELYKKLMFREDNSFALQTYDEDEVFATRMNELLEEIVEYFEKVNVPMELQNGVH